MSNFRRLIVRRGEVKKRNPLSGILEAREPLLERTRILREKGVEQQRGEAKLIDGLGLVAIATITDVFLVRHVRFGQQNRARRDVLQQVPHDLDRRMCLGQVHAGCANFIPQKPNRIETDCAGAVLNIQ